MVHKVQLMWLYSIHKLQYIYLSFFILFFFLFLIVRFIQISLPSCRICHGRAEQNQVGKLNATTTNPIPHGKAPPAHPTAMGWRCRVMLLTAARQVGGALPWWHGARGSGTELPHHALPYHAGSHRLGCRGLGSGQKGWELETTVDSLPLPHA